MEHVNPITFKTVKLQILNESECMFMLDDDARKNILSNENYY